MKALLATTTCTITATCLAAAVVVTTGGTARAGDCSTRWGSQPKVVRTTTHGALAGVRAGRHSCYDRLVLDLDRNGVGWSVRYVDAVRDQGRGAVVPLKGGAFLEVVDQSQVARRLRLPDVSGFRTFRQVADGGSFEGYTTLGLGVRARLPFQVTTADDRLVIDVAHHW